MMYLSTRGGEVRCTSAEAIKNGLAGNGGLFVPETIPSLSEDGLKRIASLGYAGRAAEIMSLFLTDYSKEEILKAANAAYAPEKFGEYAAPVRKTGGNYFLELWHGPTSAFKDMALQIMPRLLSLALDKTGEKNDAYILVATSGDTGKAALEGYRDVPRVRMTVYYPVNGVSNIQKKQMASQQGENLRVVAIKGNFDDAQTGVKSIFSDPACRAEALRKGYIFSSANSINWGRLAPQIVYYISAYCDMVNQGAVAFGEKIDVTVPTGNFGNILACFIAKRMGLPIGRMVCASNRNDVLTQFINEGVYDRRREFFTTASPSMDILISSNLERLLYFTAGSEVTADCMKKLNSEGVYSLPEGLMEEIRADFAGYSCTDAEAKEQIKDQFGKYGYLCDTHTAVAVGAAEKYKKAAGSERKMLVVSTASPYKFAPAVLSALGEEVPQDDFDALDKLRSVTGVNAPANLSGLRSAPDRFGEVISPADMKKTVFAGM